MYRQGNHNVGLHLPVLLLVSHLKHSTLDGFEGYSLIRLLQDL